MEIAPTVFPSTSTFHGRAWREWLETQPLRESWPELRAARMSPPRLCGVCERASTSTRSIGNSVHVTAPMTVMTGQSDGTLCSTCAVTDGHVSSCRGCVDDPRACRVVIDPVGDVLLARAGVNPIGVRSPPKLDGDVALSRSRGDPARRVGQADVQSQPTERAQPRSGTVGRRPSLTPIASSRCRQTRS